MIDSEKLTLLTHELMAIPSVTKHSAEIARAIDHVKEFLGPSIPFREFNHEGVASILFGDPETMLTPNLLLAGHLDVVSAPDHLFTPKQDKQILYGRGSADMKGHDAAMILAFQKYVEEGGDLKKVSLLLTGDEEVGGFNGARYLAQEVGLRPVNVFVPDADVNFDIILSQKAPHHLRIKAEGKGGHASRSFELNNPHVIIDELTRALRDRYAKATIDQPWESTFEKTSVVDENPSANLIPGSVLAWFSWRFPSELYDFEKEMEVIEMLCQQHSCEIVEQHGMGEGVYIDPEEDIIKTWKQAIEGVLERPVNYTVSHGASDARHFQKFGSKVILTSANVGEFHNDQEWADTESLALLARGLLLFMKQLDL